MDNNKITYESLESALEQKKISIKTYERVKVAKEYIEKKYLLKKNEFTEKQQEWQLINSKISELNIPDSQASLIRKEILKKEGEKLRLKRNKLKIQDFKSLITIGKGAFGEVRVCLDTKTNEIIAIKKLNKEEMCKKKEIFHIRAERDILSEAKNEWIVDLKSAFQDPVNLYFVMEFLPGGDLMNLLMMKDIVNEQETAFYSAEILLAIESVHELNCIHRDIKPDNILIDSSGHIKISDFGLCKKVDLDVFSEKQKELVEKINKNKLKLSSVYCEKIRKIGGKMEGKTNII